MEIRYEKQEDRNHFLWISGCLWGSILGSLLFPLGFLFVLCLGCVPDGWQSVSGVPKHALLRDFVYHLGGFWVTFGRF